MTAQQPPDQRGYEDATDNCELEHQNETTAARSRGEFGDIDRDDLTGPADSNAEDKSRPGQVPGGGGQTRPDRAEQKNQPG